MKQTHTILALFVAVLALPMAAVGQPASTGAASNNETIDDIVVVGQKPLSQDVRCFYENATGTHIKNHVCRARFVTKAFERHARRNRNNMSSVANQNADPIFAEKTIKYQEKVATLVAANPELQAAFVRYNTKRADFFAEREDSANN